MTYTLTPDSTHYTRTGPILHLDIEVWYRDHLGWSTDGERLFGEPYQIFTLRCHPDDYPITPPALEAYAEEVFAIFNEAHPNFPKPACTGSRSMTTGDIVRFGEVDLECRPIGWTVR